MMSAVTPPHEDALSRAFTLVHDLTGRLEKCISYSAKLEAELLQARTPPKFLESQADLDFRDFIKRLTDAMTAGSVTPEKIDQVKSALKLPSIFSLAEPLYQNMLPRAIFAFGLNAKKPVPPKPTCSCGRCGVQFEIKPQQYYHVRAGHRVYCSYTCAYPAKVPT
jgi:hypothetical protein